MDLEEYRSNLKKMVDNIKPERFLRNIFIPSANKLLADIKNRIQRKGINSGRSNIGDYSTNPYYVTQDKFVKKSAFKPGGLSEQEKKVENIRMNAQGKYELTGRKVKIKVATKGKTKGRTYKTMYLKYGYKQLRDIQGMQTQIVDLTYSTSLMQAYQLGRQGDNAVLLGFINDKEYKKAIGNEKHFGGQPIFQGSQFEINDYKENVKNQYMDFISQALKGIYGSGDVETT